MRRTPTATLLAALALAGLVAAGADDKAKTAPEPKTVASGTASDEKIEIAARAFLDKESMKEALGSDMGAGYLIVEVTVTPKGEEKLDLDLDDFLLRSDKDGQHSRPLTPSQVAGGAVMVVKSVGGQQGRGMGDQRRVPIGGYPGGGYPGGVPSTIPMGAPMGGSATADTSKASASIEDKNAGKPNPLLDALKAKVLQGGEIDHPVTGLLYFQIDGKVKPKQLELVYRKAPPRVSVRFKDPNKK
jgi:hypothetical protein